METWDVRQKPKSAQLASHRKTKPEHEESGSNKRAIQSERNPDKESPLELRGSAVGTEKWGAGSCSFSNQGNKLGECASVLHFLKM